jgi:hypothetical protein
MKRAQPPKVARATNSSASGPFPVDRSESQVPYIGLPVLLHSLSSTLRDCLYRTDRAVQVRGQPSSKPVSLCEVSPQGVALGRVDLWTIWDVLQRASRYFEHVRKAEAESLESFQGTNVPLGSGINAVNGRGQAFFEEGTIRRYARYTGDHVLRKHANIGPLKFERKQFLLIGNPEKRAGDDDIH